MEPGTLFVAVPGTQADPFAIGHAEEHKQMSAISIPMPGASSAFLVF